jgi:transcription antitermination factor NusG
MNFVSISGVPSPIPDWQIKAIQTVESSTDEFGISRNNFPPGEKVLMNSGPFY